MNRNSTDGAASCGRTITTTRTAFSRDPKRSAGERVQRARATGIGNGASGHPVLSFDGRFIAFDSAATDLVASDTNGLTDVFLRDDGLRLIGDLNGDHAVDDADYDILIQNYGRCECCAADLNGDSWVDDADRQILLNNYTN